MNISERHNNTVIGEFEIVAMTKECSMILQQKFSIKGQDLDSFKIPCSIVESIVEKPFLIWELASI